MAVSYTHLDVYKRQSEGTVSILPLIMFAAGILLKPRVVELVEHRRKTQPADEDCGNVAAQQENLDPTDRVLGPE